MLEIIVGNQIFRNHLNQLDNSITEDIDTVEDSDNTMFK